MDHASLRARDQFSLSLSRSLFLLFADSLCRPAPLACLSLSAVPYLWPFPYDALGSELRRALIYPDSSEGTTPNLDRFTFEQVLPQGKEGESLESR